MSFYLFISSFYILLSTCSRSFIFSLISQLEKRFTAQNFERTQWSGRKNESRWTRSFSEHRRRYCRSLGRWRRSFQFTFCCTFSIGLLFLCFNLRNFLLLFVNALASQVYNESIDLYLYNWFMVELSLSHLWGTS